MNDHRTGLGAVTRNPPPASASVRTYWVQDLVGSDLLTLGQVLRPPSVQAT